MQRQKPANDKQKPALRIIPGGPTVVVPPAESPGPVAGDAAKPRPKSNLGKLMSAYADAIDRDVKLLLDL